MLEAFIVTLREGVEAALIIGITLAYLAKIGRQDLQKLVYFALGAALLASVAGAVGLSRLGLNQETFEGWVMLVAAFFVVTMVVYMARVAKHLKGEIEDKVGSFAGRGSHLGLFAFVFLMVLREGVETVLVLSALSFSASDLMTFMGILLGVALAVGFGVTFVKGSARINLPKFFRVTSVILFFVALQLLVSGLHELSEAQILPASKQEMAIIGPIVRNEVFFFITMMALAGLMVLFDYRRRVPEPAPASRAEARRARWAARRERLWMSSVYVTSFLFIVLVTAQFIYAKSTTSLSPATPVTFQDGAVAIPLAGVSDHKLHRYSADVEGTEIRFLLYQKPDGNVVGVFDTCEICGPVGFYGGPEGVICKNCAAPIAPQSMGEPGGCNPVPMKIAVEGSQVVVKLAEVQAGARWFRE